MNTDSSHQEADSSVVGRPSSVVVIGTRGSKLALIQAELVRAALVAVNPSLAVVIKTITTKGDIILDRPLSAIGDKGLFVVEIEEALRAGTIDLAVHSAKDLPSDLPPDLCLAAFPARADARDALLSNGARLMELPHAALVGTSSLRRACQLRALRPDLRIADLRGNVDTRLRKLHEGQYDAIVLAAAGLARMGLDAQITELLDPAVMLPAVAQGALAVEARAGDSATLAALAALDDPVTRAVVTAERAFLAAIGGGCQTPIAGYASCDGDTLVLTGMIGALDGRTVRAALPGAVAEPAALGAALAQQLLAAGGAALLAR